MPVAGAAEVILPKRGELNGALPRLVPKPKVEPADGVDGAAVPKSEPVPNKLLVLLIPVPTDELPKSPPPAWYVNKDKYIVQFSANN